MAKEYLSSDDVKLRLNHTVCMYKEVPVWVEYIPDDTHHVRVTQLKKHPLPSEIIDYRTPDFDCRFIPLGYMQMGYKAVYLTRLPSRTQNQGLRPQNILCEPDTVELVNQNFFSTAFVNCVLGKHMGLTEAIELLKSDPKYMSISIHRHCMVGRIDGTIGLFYKGRVIAKIEPFGNSFQLFNSREASYLRNILTEIGVL